MKKTLILPSLFLLTLLATSCTPVEILVRKDVNVSIYVNEVEVEGDAGSYLVTEIPTFAFSYDADENLKTDYSFKSGSLDLGHTIPSEIGNYKYCVSVEGNLHYKPATKEITFNLIDNRVTPDLTIYLSIAGGDAYEISGDNAGSILEGYDYDFSVSVTSGVTYSTFYSSQTSSYGTVKPTIPGDYVFTVVTNGSEEYLSIERSVAFTIESSSIPPVTGTGEIEIFAINDFHGQVEPQSGRAGLVKTYSYLKAQKEDNPDALLLDQGDTFQGSIYSNYNHGALLTDVTNYCEFTARTIGNHDFDWGLADLKKCAESSYKGYKTPTLGANLVDYDFDKKTTTGTFRSDLGLTKTTTQVLSNGIKVGVVGVIGMDQITSINTLMTKDFVFYNHVEIIKSEATRLKEDLNCDVVICSVHAPTSQVLGNNLGDYVDLVLCGHSHQMEEENEGNLYFAQFDSYSKCVGNVTLTYDFVQKKVINTDITTISSNTLSYAEDDKTIVSLVESYSKECDQEASEVLVDSVSGNFYSNGALPNLMANAIYDRAVAEGYNVDLAMLNNARATLYSNEAPWKYSDIYRAFPFDNMIYIADVKGSELINELVDYTNYFYRSNTFTDSYFNPNQTYRVACIDYLFFHSGLRNYLGNEYYRTYDYFGVTSGNYIGVLSKNYREILRDWLVSNNYPAGSKKLSSSNFSSSRDNFAPFYK